MLGDFILVAQKVILGCRGKQSLQASAKAHKIQ